MAAVPRHAGLVTVCDGHPAALAWLGSVAGHRTRALGVEHFGQTGRIADLYRHYGIDAAGILAAVEALTPGRPIPEARAVPPDPDRDPRPQPQPLRPAGPHAIRARHGGGGRPGHMAKKPAWAIDKERERRKSAHPLALRHPRRPPTPCATPPRQRHRLVVTRNAAERLGEAIAAGGLEPEIADARRLPAPLDPQSVHQGAALEVSPLDWGSVSEVCAPRTGAAPTVLLLDRVTDPHNVGAILRSAEVFGARAVIAPHRHAAPETGALAKAASGALERLPYLRVPNLANAMGQPPRDGLRAGRPRRARPGGRTILASPASPGVPWASSFGAESPGMRELTTQALPSPRPHPRRRRLRLAQPPERRRRRPLRRDPPGLIRSSHFDVVPFPARGFRPISFCEAAGVEPPCFISLSLVPTWRPTIVRALFSFPRTPHRLRTASVNW